MRRVRGAVQCVQGQSVSRAGPGFPLLLTGLKILPMVTRETLFNDLPPEVKQRIINIRNMGAMQTQGTVAAPLRDLGNVSPPSVNDLHGEFLRLCSATRSLRDTNINASLQDAVTEFREFVETYRGCAGDRDFVGEMDKTVQLLEARLRKLKSLQQ